MSPGRPRRQVVDAPDAPGAIGPYSHAVVSGDLLFCSGQIPLDPATMEMIEGGVGAQARRCLENLELVCAAAGTRLGNAVRLTVYTTELDAFAEVNAACAQALPGPGPPARAVVGVAALPLGARIEIDAVVTLG